MPMETRSSSALFKRAEQLKRWQESETNQESSEASLDKLRRIRFSDGCVFLAACAAGDKEEVDRLLAQGADINTANVDGLTALHQACIDDNLDMVEFLVEHGCDLNRGDNEGWTPLHATSSCGFVSIARYLIESGADVAAVNNDGDLPIDIGESGDIEELLQVEINRLGIDCDSVRGHEENKMLEDARQWLNSHTIQEQLHPKTGASALHVAAAKGYMKVMGILIQAGADLNAQDNDGWTPLHAASHWGQREACRILAENLANMDIKNYAGQTCFDVSDPDMIKLLEELKNKQASMQRERPEIEAILQRVCKAPPPLKRRTSVTRMSGADKSSQVIKDTILERAQIENLRLEEEEEEDKGMERKHASAVLTPVSEAEKVTERKEPKPAQQNEVNVVERINEPVIADTLTKEIVNEAKPKLEKLNETAIPSLKKETSPEEEKAQWRNRKVGPGISPQSSLESPSSVPVAAAPVVVALQVAQEKPKPEENNILPIGMKLKLKTEREDSEDVSDEPSTPSDEVLNGQAKRDEESEAQRKAHAKRVRETRRSTQGVTLEDLKSAEQQLLRKQQEEDERKEKERDMAKKLPPLPKSEPAAPPSIITAPTNTASITPKSTVTITPTTLAATTTTTATTATTTVPAAEKVVPEKRLSWRIRADENAKVKEEPKDLKAKEEFTNARMKVEPKPTKDEPVVLRRLPEPNQIVSGSVGALITSHPETAAQPVVTNAGSSLRTRQRPVSAPAETATNIALRTRIKNESRPDTEAAGDNEDQENEDDAKGLQGGQAGIQRRKRPKRRSTGVVYLDGEGNSEQPVDGSQDNEKEEKPSSSASDRFRSRYGSSSSLQDDASTPSRLSDRSRTTSLNSSTTSLNEDTDKDYKKMYFELKDDNERLKKKLSKAEIELDSTRQELQRTQRNMRNSVNDGDKRERRALERKLSELEEELKEFEKVQSDNQRLRDENGALIRVISKLSK